MSTLKTDINVVLGTGPLGLAVMDELIARDRSVMVVNRSGRLEESLPVGVDIVPGDLNDPDVVTRLCAGADVVFQCAQPPYAQWPELFPPLIAGIVDGVSRTGARLVVGDNLYMYGPTNGAPLHEDLPYAATGPKGRTRARLARQLLDAHDSGKLQVALGRASDFYGPRVLDSAAGDIIFGAALAGQSVNTLGNPDLPHTLTYIRDFARALVTLSEESDAFGRAWHVPSAETIAVRQFVEMVGQEVDRPLEVRAAGPLLVAVLGIFNRELREMKEMMYEFTEPYIVEHKQFEAAFGKQVTPHKEAIAETVAWYREHAERPA